MKTAEWVNELISYYRKLKKDMLIDLSDSKFGTFVLT